MKGLRYFLFSAVCLFCCSIVFAANEVVIKSITPIYDEGSSVIVSNENVTFNDKNQSVKYKIVIENTLDYELKVTDIDLAKPTADYLIYEIDGITKGDILRSKEIKEIELSLLTTEKSNDASDFNEELLTVVRFEHNVENPYTNVKQVLIVLVGVFGISIVCFLLLEKQKISRYITIIIVCFSVIPVIKASSSIVLEIRINVNYETPSPISIVSGDGTKVGDELKIGEEHFYVVSNDGTEAVLLAKYNLEVGRIYTRESGSWVFVDIENPSGLQNDKALGFDSDGTEYYGVIPFSSTNYWWHNSGYKDEYGTSYPAYVYDDNASIKTYVDNYKDYLENLGIVVSTARLIKYEELIELGCDTPNWTCRTSNYNWMYSTSYWSGSAYGDTHIWYVRSDGYFDHTNYDFENVLGVRPVIVISSSEI